MLQNRYLLNQIKKVINRENYIRIPVDPGATTMKHTNQILIASLIKRRNIVTLQGCILVLAIYFFHTNAKNGDA